MVATYKYLGKQVILLGKKKWSLMEEGRLKNQLSRLTLQTAHLGKKPCLMEIYYTHTCWTEEPPAGQPFYVQGLSSFPYALTGGSGFGFEKIIRSKLEVRSSQQSKSEVNHLNTFKGVRPKKDLASLLPLTGLKLIASHVNAKSDRIGKPRQWLFEATDAG